MRDGLRVGRRPRKRRFSEQTTYLQVADGGLGSLHLDDAFGRQVLLPVKIHRVFRHQKKTGTRARTQQGRGLLKGRKDNPQAEGLLSARITTQDEASPNHHS